MEPVEDSLTSDEEEERRSIDETEQVHFLGVIAEELIKRGYFPPGKKNEIHEQLFLWWTTEPKDVPWNELFRTICCEGDRLRIDLYREFKAHPDHRERAVLILGRLGYSSLETFLERETDRILEALRGDAVEKIEETVHDGATRVRAAS